jgi:hypothetical protein
MPTRLAPNPCCSPDWAWSRSTLLVLCTAIQEHYRIQMPFAELLADIGQKQRDLSIAELAEFVNQHIGAGEHAEQSGKETVEAGSPRSV